MSATHDALVEALTVERYDQTWWRSPNGDQATPRAQTVHDSELDQARRRLDLAKACEDDVRAHPDEDSQRRYRGVTA